MRQRMQDLDCTHPGLRPAAASGGCKLLWSVTALIKNGLVVSCQSCPTGGGHMVGASFDLPASVVFFAGYLQARFPDVTASVHFTVHDRTTGDAQHLMKLGKDVAFDATNPVRGFARFAALEQLRSRPGYLAGDRLVIQVTVMVLSDTAGQ